jgi:hypothetical protein
MTPGHECRAKQARPIAAFGPPGINRALVELARIAPDWVVTAASAIPNGSIHSTIVPAVVNATSMAERAAVSAAEPGYTKPVNPDGIRLTLVCRASSYR